jgi:hypothetical protein
MYKCKKMYQFNFKGYFIGTLCYEFSMSLTYHFDNRHGVVVFSVHLTDDKGCGMAH